MRKLIIFLMLLLVGGCASTSVKKYPSDVIYPATNPANIVIFPDKPKGKEFSELGEITVTGASNWPQVEKIFQNKAANMGADAVYVFSKQEEKKQYLYPDDCFMHEGYYYPYHHFGWHHYRGEGFYPMGYYYCYGYQSTMETTTFISAVGIVIKYNGPVS